MNNKNQQGYTLITTLIIPMVMVFFVLLGIKIVPIYMNHSKVQNSFVAIDQTKGVGNMPTRKIRDIINTRFKLNDIENIKASDVKIYSSPSYLKLMVDYVVLEPIIGNLSIQVVFHEEIVVSPEDDS